MTRTDAATIEKRRQLRAHMGEDRFEVRPARPRATDAPSPPDATCSKSASNSKRSPSVSSIALWRERFELLKLKG